MKTSRFWTMLLEKHHLYKNVSYTCVYLDYFWKNIKETTVSGYSREEKLSDMGPGWEIFSVFTIYNMYSFVPIEFCSIYIHLPFL